MRDQFKAVHHVPTIGNEASGPAYSVPRLVSSLNDAGYASELFTTEPAPSLPVPSTTVFANGWGSSVCCHSRDLKHAILNACKEGRASVLHTHGMWDYSTTYLAHASRKSGIPLVFSPRGTLLPPALARHKFRKRALWRLLANPILEQATAFHATSDEEAHHLREYSKGRPVVVIPNGIDLPSLADTPKDIPSGDRTVLFLGRVHPIKNVDRLITAWSNLESRFPQWRLRIVGTAEASYGSFLKNLAAELQVQRVDFPGPAFGSDKLREYTNADLYVLPSSTENFGMTVAEALAAGTPAIVTTRAPWNGITEHGAGWVTDVDVAALSQSLDRAMSHAPYELQAKGAAGRRWMHEKFQWRAIGAQMAEFYLSLPSRAPNPRTPRTTERG